MDPDTRTLDCGVGARLERTEDPSLIAGCGRFGDDLGYPPGTLHAAIVRSPHAHARIVGLDVADALSLEGVHSVIDGTAFAKISKPLLAVIRVSMEVRPCAVDKVRYVGEPVAVVLADDRYVAEDAAERVIVDYETLAPVIDPERALDKDAPLLHPDMGANVVSDRVFNYGDPEKAFREADRAVDLTIRYPRNSCTPLEGYVVLAEFDPGNEVYTMRSNFQGPFSLHPVMARSLGVPGPKLRLISNPDSGGSFGIKQAVFPVIVLMGLAARMTGRPTAWVEDRLEHLSASSSATNRITHIRAAVTADGRLLGLDFDQIDDVGAYLRAPEPASLYRMHGNLAGAYGVCNVRCRNRVVVTNKTPTGLNRGFGGPQHYFALERLMQRISVELGLDPVDVIRRNLVPAESFPYQSASGALLDSGRYHALVDKVLTEDVRADFAKRRMRAERDGRLYGVGYVAAVEPSVSNMGYITTALTPAQRNKAGPKGGAIASAAVAIDPAGGLSVTSDGIPQGQGHRTVLAQVVAETFGINAALVTVNTEVDTQKDAWSIAAGNYSSRFAGAVAGAAVIAARRLRDRLADMAAAHLNCVASDVVFENGQVAARDNPENAMPLQRFAGMTHWSAGGTHASGVPVLRETTQWSPPQLEPPDEQDRINSSLAYGFVFDVCGLEIDPATGACKIDRYITGHDAGKLLNPLLADGQIYGAFAHGIGAAFLEAFEYSDDGAFLSGTFADYLIPTTCEVVQPEIVHMETPSPFTPLGAKGLGEGNCMSTPVAVANAVADALGVEDIELPLTRSRIHALLNRDIEEPAGREETGEPPNTQRAITESERRIRGQGKAHIRVPPEDAWKTLLSPETLAAVIPGCKSLEVPEPDHFTGRVKIGIGPVRGEYRFEVRLRDMDPPRSVRLVGSGTGSLGAGSGEGLISLVPDGAGGTELHYQYCAEASGKVAAVGGRMLDAAARMLARQFFEALAKETGGELARASGIWTRLIAWVRGQR